MWISDDWDLAQIYGIRVLKEGKESGLTSHSDRLARESSLFVGEDLVEFYQINKDPSKQEVALHILYCKRNLIMGLYYLLILKFNSGAPSIHSNTLKLKK